MKSKKVKKILLIALTCVAISASVSAEAAMKSQITIESKNKYITNYKRSCISGIKSILMTPNQNANLN